MAIAVDIRGVPLEEVGFQQSDLVGEDWTTPRNVGAAAAWLNIGCLLVPSARHPEANIVVFVDELQPGDFVEVA